LRYKLTGGTPAKKAADLKSGGLRYGDGSNRAMILVGTHYFYNLWDYHTNVTRLNETVGTNETNATDYFFKRCVQPRLPIVFSVGFS
jgi:hypothetical protein